MMEKFNPDVITKLKAICIALERDVGNTDRYLVALKDTIEESPQIFVRKWQRHLLGTALYYLGQKENRGKYPEDIRMKAIDILSAIFSKITVETVPLYFNISAQCLGEIYDLINGTLVPGVSEEFKLTVTLCLCILTKALSWDILQKVYVIDNAPKLCTVLQVCLEIIKNEKLRSLRITAIECLMHIFKVYSDEDLHDKETRSQIARVFMFFLPGIASGLFHVVTSDEKIGSRVIAVALQAWGRITALLMENYGENLGDGSLRSKEIITIKKKHKERNRGKLKGQAEIKNYLKNMEIDTEWYLNSDKKLKGFLMEMVKLASFQHDSVRKELYEVCHMFIEKCFATMPKSIPIIVEILIVLKEDENKEIQMKANEALEQFSKHFNRFYFRTILDNLRERFYNLATTLPRIFNGIDEKEQLRCLNLAIGLTKLFGKEKFVSIFNSSPQHLGHFMSALLEICSLEKANVSSLEECGWQDFKTDYIGKPWRKFSKFEDAKIAERIGILCGVLSEVEDVNVTGDYLLSVFYDDPERRKEVTFVLNEMLSRGDELSEEKVNVITNVLNCYIEEEYWDLPLNVGDKGSLSEIQLNILQVCLQIEGIGLFALVLQEKFQKFLLRTFYLVLERAGNGQPYLRQAGLQAIKNISTALSYDTVSDLINANTDYFSFHAMRKINRPEFNESVVNVLAIVMKFSEIKALPAISQIVETILDLSYSRFKEQNTNSYLRLFKIFTESLLRWLDIEVKLEQIKSKAQKENEEEEFRVSNLNYEETFDDLEGKTIEEMYKEDAEDKEDLWEVNKEKNLPLHVQLTVAVLKTSLNFLPSRDLIRKLLVLDILRNGLEIIREHEDELLPVVHLIWCPLVDRFKEFDKPIVMRNSFQLLQCLGRLSKDFIRSRTVKDVLPSLLEILRNLSRESYLKDKGSAYRYTNSFKLQLEILEGVGRLVLDLDMNESQIDSVVEVVKLYLSNKQPIPLQRASVGFFENLSVYDTEYVAKKLEKEENEELAKNINSIRNFVKNLLNKTKKT